MPTVEGKIFPGELFLVRGRDGKGHCYSQDPMKVKDRESVEVDLAEALFNFYGESDPVNPMVLHVSGVVFNRGEAFNISMPAKVRSGSYDGHFEDMEGNIVEVLPMRGSDPLFPVNGIVLNKEGVLVAQRHFNGTGQCEDGDEYHRLIVVNGALKEDVRDDGEGAVSDL